MKVGLFYHSNTGNTRKIASLIEERIRGLKIAIEMIEIHPQKRPNFITGRYSALMNKALPVTNDNFNMSPYDLILIGFPLWVGKPSPFITTFLNNATNVAGKKIACFFTYANDPIHQQAIKEKLEQVAKEKQFHLVKRMLPLKMKHGAILSGEKKINGFIVDLFTK